MKQGKHSKQKRYGRRNLLVAAGVLIAAMTGIFLPDMLFAVQEQNEYTQINAVEEKYLASSSSLARTVSANLRTYEKLQLAAGQWESERQAAEAYEMEQENYEVIALAREQMKKLYDVGLYPVDLSSKYGNWYAWTLSPYKFVDTTFHTYTAYCWEIRFEKYDKSELHVVQMIEDGTIIMAHAAGQLKEDTLADNRAKFSELKAKTDSVTSLDIYNYNVKELLPYEADTSAYDKDSLTWITKDEKSYLLFQFFSENAYMYALTPSL